MTRWLELGCVDFDRLAIGTYCLRAGELYKKVSPLILSNVATGKLLFDARLFPEYTHAESFTVVWVQLLPVENSS